MKKPGVEPKRAIDFLRILQNLKATKRTGWVRKGVRGPESIADHMYRMSVMAMIAGDDGGKLDRNKCIKLAIAHDIAEAIAGDIAPSDNVPKEEKHRLEREALESMTEVLGGDREVSEELSELWHEYEAGETEEAKLLKDLDKVEMILQALEYEDQQADLDLAEFFDSVEGKLKTETGRKWAEEIARRRRERLGK
ncbi:HD domain-containing protein [Chloropicon primus]|uniref:5'-deoxynucleotidase n=1 Tax=Chloropicon primus TaxID=1764295 RepID=A0A5B8ME92_9CHLO|nr:HD domain-containing protein [Chloropicon primus]UPQ97956.1 HD domain-containing protein [Chloropicon primus]|mmetsp:Transcript_1347/g.3867  ORF Transcript_1347/g.3867 Transcript_1347/m.3867 type:complete len:195 (+) Transcript_1347:91-675(+)|eukprot:QDZ18749.1 HD domain-containing protein [Chloropicon primus]